MPRRTTSWSVGRSVVAGIEAVLEEVGVGAHPAGEALGLEQGGAELALDERAKDQRGDDQDELVHGAPERVGVATERARLDERLIARGVGEHAMEEVGAGLGALGEGPA